MPIDLNSKSPLPRSLSAPESSNAIHDSRASATRKATLAGSMARIAGVTTFARGYCVLLDLHLRQLSIHDFDGQFEQCFEGYSQGRRDFLQRVYQVVAGSGLKKLTIRGEAVVCFTPTSGGQILATHNISGRVCKRAGESITTKKGGLSSPLVFFFRSFSHRC